MSRHCLVCETTRPDPPSHVCTGCRMATTENLLYLSYAFTALSPMLEPGAHDSSGVGGGASGSRPPVSMAVLSLLGPDQPNGSVSGNRIDQIGGPSILAVLGAWQRMWWELEPDKHRPPIPVRDADMAARWLVRRQQWAVTNLEPYREFSHEIGKVAHACLTMLAEHKDRMIRIPGRCPVPDMDNDGVRCGAILVAHVDADSIKCHRCGGSWPRHAWPLLGRLMAGVA